MKSFPRLSQPPASEQKSLSVYFSHHFRGHKSHYDDPMMALNALRNRENRRMSIFRSIHSFVHSIVISTIAID